MLGRHADEVSENLQLLQWWSATPGTNFGVSINYNEFCQVNQACLIFFVYYRTPLPSNFVLDMEVAYLMSPDCPHYKGKHALLKSESGKSLFLIVRTY